MNCHCLLLLILYCMICTQALLVSRGRLPLQWGCCRATTETRKLPVRVRPARAGQLCPRSMTSGRPAAKSYTRYHHLFYDYLKRDPVKRKIEINMADIIDGKQIAADIRVELKEKTASLRESKGVVPGLAVILVGERRDSATYVRMKKKACEEVGIKSFGFDYPSTVTEEELLSKISELNGNEDVHGILVQLPLPEHINEQNVLDAISVEKDVDGLHPLNVASLCSGRTHAGATKKSWDFNELDFHVACTPQGCIELLDRSGVEISGSNAVVLGRSNIVGIPVAMLLMHRNATVTIVHSRTKNTPEVVSRADIVVAAVGRAEMVKKEWLKPGCVVIDVGINSVDDPESKKGYRLVGDVDFEGCKSVASKITPVPGGCGPMTIAMLLRNTYHGAVRKSS